MFLFFQCRQSIN